MNIGKSINVGCALLNKKKIELAKNIGKTIQYIITMLINFYCFGILYVFLRCSPTYFRSHPLQPHPHTRQGQWARERQQRIQQHRPRGMQLSIAL